MKTIQIGDKKVSYEESLWTGKKTLYVNGVACRKVSKTQFAYSDGEKEQFITVNGNSFKGVTLKMEEGEFIVEKKPAWYEYVLSFFALILVITWGNSPALVEKFVVVGGAIGGAIAGLFGALNLTWVRKTDNVFFKILISLGSTVAAVLVCHFVGLLIVDALAAASM